MSSAWIVVLNWNGKQDTLELLASLQRARLADTTVLVVDNGSSDGTLDAVRQAFPWARRLQTGSNLGYAGGNNRGVMIALASGADVVGVLNNDTVVTEGFWAPLVAAASKPMTAVSPDIRYSREPEISWFFGGVVRANDGYPRHLLPAEQPGHDALTTTELLTGCCLVAHADTWRLVGGFDERLFLIFEDADWCMRARYRGVQLLLEPGSIIVHKVSQSFQGPAQGIGAFYFVRNGVVFARRWLGPGAAARFALRRGLAEGLRELRTSRRPAIRPFLLRMMALFSAFTPRLGPAGALVRAAAAPRRSGRRLDGIAT